MGRIYIYFFLNKFKMAAVYSENHYIALFHVIFIVLSVHVLTLWTSVTSANPNI